MKTRVAIAAHVGTLAVSAALIVVFLGSAIGWGQSLLTNFGQNNRPIPRICAGAGSSSSTHDAGAKFTAMPVALCPARAGGFRAEVSGTTCDDLRRNPHPGAPLACRDRAPPAY
jgi:hypothetical protein